MKILLLSKIPYQFYKFLKPGEMFPENQVQRFWLKALQNLGHQVEVIYYSQPIILSPQIWSQINQLAEKTFPQLFHKFRLVRNYAYRYFPDNYLRSQQLRQKIQNFQPQVLIVSGGISELSGQGLIAAKELDTKIVLLHGVHPDQGGTKFERQHLYLFDWIITNDPEHALAWRKIGAQKTFALPYSGIDEETHRDFKHKRDIDVLFLGTLFEDRQKMLAQLISKDICIDIYGYVPKETGLLPTIQAQYQGEAWAEKMINLFNRSKIVINILPGHMPQGGNLRTFEIPGCGALQLANRCPSEWYTPNKEIVIFDSVTDLASKVDYYLKYPQKREKIAQNGYLRTHRDYTYEQRFKKILA